MKKKFELPPVEDDLLGSNDSKKRKKEEIKEEDHPSNDGSYQCFVCLDLEFQEKRKDEEGEEKRKENSYQFFDKIIEDNKNQYPHLFFNQIEKNKLHISLSKTFNIKRFQIDELIDLFKLQVAKIDLSPFKFKFDQISFLQNDEKDKTFLSLIVSENSKQNVNQFFFLQN